MKSITYLMLCTIIVIVSLINCRQEPVWQEFSSDEGEFSVMMPGIPKEYGFTVIDEEEKPVKMYVYRAKSPGHQFVIMHSNVIEDEDLEDIAELGIEARWGRWKITDRDIEFMGYPAMEHTFQGPSRTAIMRTYSIEDRVYILQVYYKNRKASQDDISNFLESFKLYDEVEEVWVQ